LKRFSLSSLYSTLSEEMQLCFDFAAFAKVGTTYFSSGSHVFLCLLIYPARLFLLLSMWLSHFCQSQWTCLQICTGFSGSNFILNITLWFLEKV